MKKAVYSLLLIFIFNGCSSSKKVPVETIKEKPKAQWMISPPSDPNYYVGIGMVNKSIEQGDYPSTSKKRALDALASSIKIKISSSSVLHQMDQSSGYNENYSSLIKSSSNINLEGYELVDVWENNSEYWTYYRLKKSVHEELQKERKRLVTEKAFNYYNLATQYEKSNKIALALKNYLDGLFTLKEYLGEQVLVDTDHTKTDLTASIYQGVQNCLLNMSLSSPQSIVRHKISSDSPLNIPVSVENRIGTVSNLFIETTYLADDQFGHTSKKKKLLRSSNDGICQFVYENIAKKTITQSIKFTLDITQIPVIENDEKLRTAVYSSLIVPEKLVEVQIIMPKVYFSLQEKNINEPIIGSGIGPYISNGLSKNGIVVINDKKNADYIIEVFSNTEKNGEFNGVYSTQLNTNVKLRDQSSHVLYQKQLTGIKGSQLTYQKAGIEAYKNAEDEIKFKLLKELLKELL